MELQLLGWLGLFILSLGVLIKAANIFTKVAEQVGLAWRIPPFIVGVTIVSLGTTIPELASSLIAMRNGASEIVPGNVLGSAVANVLLVLGLAALIAPSFKTSWKIIRTEIPLLGGAALLAILTMWDGKFTLAEGLISLGAYGLYIILTALMRRRYQKLFRTKPPLKKPELGWFTTFLKLALCALFIYLGAEFTVASLTAVADFLNINAGIISALLLAVGTSLPELTIAIQSALRGKPEIGVGNVLGANIIDLLFVMGAASLVGVIKIPSGLIYVGLPFMALACVLYFLVNRDRQVTKLEGGALVGLYVVFLVALFIFGGQ